VWKDSHKPASVLEHGWMNGEMDEHLERGIAERTEGEGIIMVAC
jgi:hypothetical protein